MVQTSLKVYQLHRLGAVVAPLLRVLQQLRRLVLGMRVSVAISYDLLAVDRLGHLLDESQLLGETHVHVRLQCELGNEFLQQGPLVNLGIA